MIQEILEALRGSPVLFMIGMGTLPLVGVPLSAFWLAAGAAFKPPWYAFAIIMGGLAINFALAYLISNKCCLLYTSPSPRDLSTSRMPSSA